MSDPEKLFYMADRTGIWHVTVSGHVADVALKCGSQQRVIEYVPAAELVRVRERCERLEATARAFHAAVKEAQDEGCMVGLDSTAVPEIVDRWDDAEADLRELLSATPPAPPWAARRGPGATASVSGGVSECGSC